MLINILISLGLTVLLVTGFRYVLDYEPQAWVVLAVYFTLFVSVAWFRSPRGEESGSDFPDDAPPDLSGLPLSGPFRILGRHVGGMVFLVVFTVTNLLSALNPFQFTQVIRQMSANTRLIKRERQTGDYGTEYRNKVGYRLPFEGEWMVFSGGMTPRTSHSWDLLGQRFALDFVQVDENLARHAGKGIRREDYYCHGEPILAASDGEVVAVEDRISEAPLVGFGVCDFIARNFVGNHVVIQHAEGEYGLYAHLVPGSVPVTPGERVKQGQEIGRCGHSGHSSEPHLHFHLQDSPDPFGGMGLPVRFDSLEVDGQPVAAGHVMGGQRVSNQSGARPEFTPGGAES